MANNSRSIKQMLEQLYLDRDQTGDAIFLVECQQIRAHRNVLAAMSPKYKAQFYGPNPDQGEIRIPDVSAAAFQEFLQFFYKESVDLTMGNIASVLDLAQQSLAEGFIEICIGFLKKSITTSNVCFIYHLAILCDIESLRLDCEEQISFKTMDVFASDDFLQCDRDVLCHILKLDTFSCSEKDVFNVCVEWAREDCKQKGLDETKAENLRSALGDTIRLVRFTSMNAEEFAILHKSLDGFFMADELRELACIIAKLMDFTPKFFDSTSRTPYNELKDRDHLETLFNRSTSWSLECNRFERILEKPENIFDVDREHFIFACDHPIRFHGFVLGLFLDGFGDDIFWLNATIRRYKEHFVKSIELRCKIHRDTLRKNETIILFDSPIERITNFNCFFELPIVKLNYKLILKRVNEVNNVSFGLRGKWVTRFLFDKM